MSILKITFVLLAIYACNLWAANDGSIKYPSVTKALETLKKKPSANISQQAGWTIISLIEDGNHVVWFFSPEQHKAHPAVVKRTYVTKKGGIEITTTTLCEAPKNTCDDLAVQFDNISGHIK